MHGKNDPIRAHGGYRELKSFQMSEIVFDATVKFCERFVDRFSRTTDQMVQAARSGRQNIAEGSQASGTSSKTELKLVSVAEHTKPCRTQRCPGYPSTAPAKYVLELNAGKAAELGVKTGDILELHLD